MAGQLSRRDTGSRGWWDESPLANVRQEMDQLLSRFLGGEEGMGSMMSPSLDLSETDNEIEVRMDLPGYHSDEIDVNLNRDMLTICGEHSEKKEEKADGRRYHRIERRHGSFHRSVQLPATVNEKKVDASFKDGVLTIKLPKSAESKSHKISVKT